MSIMKKAANSDPRPGVPYDARLTEIAYHTNFNRSTAIFGSVIFLFFSVFFYHLENYFQASIFFLLFADAASAVLLGYWINSTSKLVRMKFMCTATAFFFWAVSLIAGVLSDDIYIFFPWIFVYPITIMLMFGKRGGTHSTIVFFILMSVTLVLADLPEWDQSHERLLKLNSVLALFVLLMIAFFAEKARIRVQKDLISAQNNYKTAEQRQREINLELEQEIRLRGESEAALAQSEIRYRAFFEESPVSIWEEDWSLVKQYIDKHAKEIKGDFNLFLKENSDVFDYLTKMIRINTVNQAALELHGADSQETLLENMAHILPESYEAFIVDKLAALSRCGRYQAEMTSQTIHRRPLYLLVSSSIPVGFENSWGRIYTTIFDNTERVLLASERDRVRRQLQSARQIQAVATLAGGIAHKFNNALMVIQLNLELIELETRGNASLDKILAPIKQSTEKIGRLTEQLLAYAQGGKYQPKRFSVNELLRDVLTEEKMSPKPSVRVITDFDPDICTVEGDVTQIKMVMQAVIFNAFESIADSGTVTIRTLNGIVGDNDTEDNLNVLPGKYAITFIEDDGDGMNEETRQRIFEPFFTTKVLGRGLGMAASYGIVKNHLGLITVQSKEDHGSIVKIYLPEDNG